MSRIYFAQIREDALVERRFLSGRRRGRVVCIGSGGCTALSLLDDTVETLLCVDSNPAQCALIELRKAAVAELSREAYLEFIGERPCVRRLETYATLARRLPQYAREFWQTHLSDVVTGINHAGVTEAFYRFASENLRSCVCPDEVFSALFQCVSLEEQRAMHARYFDNETWLTALRVLFSRTTHQAFFPAFMFAAADAPDFGRFFAEQFQRELLSRPIGNNYFLSQFLFGSYLHGTREGTPGYLSPTGYETARRNIHKLVVFARPLEEVLEEETAIDAFCLSNVFDWMGTEQRERTCRAVLAAAKPGAALVFRNMLGVPSMPREFVERVRREEAACRTALEVERSMLYRRITLGDIQ